MIYSYNLKRMYRDARILASDLSLKNKNTKRAAKSGLSAVISVFICYSINMESAFFARITAIIMLQPSFGATIKKALMRSVGTIAGFFLSIFIFGLYVQNHTGFTIAIFLIMTIIFYKKVTAKYPYAWYIVGITFVIIIETALIAPDTNLIIEVAVQRASCVLIAIVVSVIIDIYIWPDYAFEVRDSKFNKIKKDLLEFHQAVFSEYLNMKYNKIDIRYKYSRLVQGLNSIKGIVGLSSIEAKTIKGVEADTKYKCKVIQRNLDKIYDFYRSISKLQNVSFQKYFKLTCFQVIDNISELFNAIENDDSKKQDMINKSIIGLFNQLDLQYKKNIIKGKNRTHSVADVLLYNEFTLILKQILKTCLDKRTLNIESFDFSSLISKIEEMKFLMRKGAMKDMEILEKQSYSHTVLTLKRVANKLKAITEQQIKIDLLTTA
jgi:p-hydroxybenzoic acid efflux pump subunit AaeB